MPEDRPLSHVVVAGASGLIGGALRAALIARGARVTSLVRRPVSGPDEVSWLVDDDSLDPDVLAGADAVIVVTEWDEYRRELDPAHAASLVSGRVIVDGRNCLDAAAWRAA